MSAPAPRNDSDWHPADIKAALEKRGYNFARIARENGYRDQSPKAVLRLRWRAVEAIVGQIIGVPAAEIWPSRYARDVGRPCLYGPVPKSGRRTIRTCPNCRTEV